MLKGVPIRALNGLSWTAEDLAKKFNGVFVLAYVLSDKIKEPTPEVYQIQEVGGSALSARTSDSSWVNYPHKNFYVVEDRPDPCVTNFGDAAFIFKHDPKRQWQRGVHHNNCFIYVAPEMQQVQQHGVSFSHAEAIYKPKWDSNLEEALKNIGKGAYRARALNNKYVLAKDKGSTAVKLYRAGSRWSLMGSFMGSKFFPLEEAARLFKKELAQEIPTLKEKFAFRGR